MTSNRGRFRFTKLIYWGGLLYKAVRWANPIPNDERKKRGRCRGT